MLSAWECTFKTPENAATRRNAATSVVDNQVVFFINPPMMLRFTSIGKVRPRRRLMSMTTELVPGIDGHRISIDKKIRRYP